TGKQIGQVALPPLPDSPKGKGFGLGPAVATGKQLAFSPDGRCLAVDLEDGTAVLYELATCQPRSTFGKKAAGVGRCCFAFSPDGKSLAQSGPDGIVHVWDIRTGKELDSFRGHAEA